MGANIAAIIQIDDNTPADAQAFSNDPSTWDLRLDYGLCGCKDYRFISAISGVRADEDFRPLFGLRGAPPRLPSRLAEYFEGEPLISWLNVEELNAAIAHAGHERPMYARSVQSLLRVIDTLAENYGHDRIRFVFAILD